MNSYIYILFIHNLLDWIRRSGFSCRKSRKSVSWLDLIPSVRKEADIYFEEQDKLAVVSSKDSRIARKLLRESHEVPSRIQFSRDQPTRSGELWKSADWNAYRRPEMLCRYEVGKHLLSGRNRSSVFKKIHCQDFGSSIK